MCLERELCSECQEARRRREAHCRDIRQTHTCSNTTWNVFTSLKYYTLLEPKCVNIVVYLHKQAKEYAIFTNVINKLFKNLGCKMKLFFYCSGCHRNDQTRFHKEPSWEDIVLNKIPCFNLKTFVQWKDSINAKGSSWNINSNKEPLFIYYVMERFFGY